MESLLIHRDEAVYSLDGRRNVEVVGERFRLVKRRLTALDRVDDIMLDTPDVTLGNIAGKDIHARGSDPRTLTVGQQLNALRAGIRSLIELSRQVLDREDDAVRPYLVIDDIALRLGEDGVLRFREHLLIDALDIVAVQDPETGEPAYHQVLAYVREQAPRLHGVRRLLFDVYSVYHFPTPYSIQLFMECRALTRQHLLISRRTRRSASPRVRMTGKDLSGFLRGQSSSTIR